MVTNTDLWLSICTEETRKNTLIYCKRLAHHLRKSPQDAEDALSYAMEMTWLRIDKFDATKPFAPWFCEYAKNYLVWKCRGHCLRDDTPKVHANPVEFRRQRQFVRAVSIKRGAQPRGIAESVIYKTITETGSGKHNTSEIHGRIVMALKEHGLYPSVHWNRLSFLEVYYE